MHQERFMYQHLESSLKTLGTLLLLGILFFPTAVVVLFNLLVNQKKSLAKIPDAKTILLTGGKMTKALQLARSFHIAGHRVILVETEKYWLTGHRFSKAVSQFYTVPSPEKDPEAYTQRLVDIAQQEKVDFFIPVSSPVASYYDSLAKLRLQDHCETLHLDPEMTQLLDNKYTFCKKAEELGLSIPQAFYITDPEQVLTFDFAQTNKRYILKSIPYDSVYRLKLKLLPCPDMAEYLKTLPISPEKPWILQEFIQGEEFCTHSTVRKGQIRLHCCSRSSAFQVNYQHVDHPKILQWVQQFVGTLHLTGQISFDFIQAEDGTVFPVECNPRLHSAITLFHDHPDVASAYLAPSLESILFPLTESKPTYWLYHELWRLTHIRSWQQGWQWLQNLRQGTDAIFRAEDPLPFLAVHHFQIPGLLLDNLRRFRGWIRIDFNIGKLVELGGD
jgi:glutathione synthase/RimK-type ligase-like ATP-grasp enzyme